MQISEGLQGLIDEMTEQFGAKSLYVVDIFAEAGPDEEQLPTVILGMRDAETPLILAQRQATQHLEGASDQKVTVEILTDPIEEANFVFDKYLRSYIATHGGIVTPVEADERLGKLWITMDGGCSGCPSSIATLKHGIERTLKKHLPWVEHVEALNEAVEPDFNIAVDFSITDVAKTDADTAGKE